MKSGPTCRFIGSFLVTAADHQGHPSDPRVKLARHRDKEGQIQPPVYPCPTASMQMSSHSTRSHPPPKKIRTFLNPLTLPSHSDANVETETSRWAQLIRPPRSAAAVITNYRQASDGRLKPGILSGGWTPTSGENSQSSRLVRRRRCSSNASYLPWLSEGY